MNSRSDSEDGGVERELESYRSALAQLRERVAAMLEQTTGSAPAPAAAPVAPVPVTDSEPVSRAPEPAPEPARARPTVPPAEGQAVIRVGPRLTAVTPVPQTIAPPRPVGS